MFKNNPALKLLVFLFATVVFFFSFWGGDDVAVHQKTVETTKVEQVSNSDDAASDTAAEDRLRLSGQMDSLSQTLSTVQEQLNKSEKLNKALHTEIERIKGEISKNKKEQKRFNIKEAENVSSSEDRSLNNPNVNQSFDSAIESISKPSAASHEYKTAAVDDKISWIGDEKGFFQSVSEDLTGTFSNALEKAEGGGGNKSKKNKIQYATIDSEAVLFDALLFDTLIGVSPNQTGVVEPYRFKVELSNENLMTSGVQLPEIEKMRMSGYSVGEWSTSCVKGYITSATFVFKDGRISTIGKPGLAGEKLAYITDEYGSPCLAGEKHSSLLEYASIHGSLKSISSIGKALSNAQFTSSSSNAGVNSAFTGSQSKLALGEGVNGGFDAISQTVAARYANVRDVIVAKPETVVIQLNKQIEIDYDPNGRLLLNNNFNAELDAYYESQEQSNIN